MNAAETIQAAIEKLTDQRESAALGPWVNLTDESEVSNDNGWVIGDASFIETAALIVTLHATIDAQLALLHLAARQITVGLKPLSQIVTLANSIVSEQGTDD